EGGDAGVGSRAGGGAGPLGAVRAQGRPEGQQGCRGIGIVDEGVCERSHVGSFPAGGGPTSAGDPTLTGGAPQAAGASQGVADCGGEGASGGGAASAVGSAQSVAGVAQVAGRAQGSVGDVDAADGDLVPVEDERAGARPAVEHRPAAAPADGLELLEGVADLQEAGGAGERAGPEVRADAVRHDGNIAVDGDPQEPVDLAGLQELGLVDQQAADWQTRILEGLDERGAVDAAGGLVEEGDDVVVRTDEEVDL